MRRRWVLAPRAAGREPQHLLRDQAQPVPSIVIEVTAGSTVALSTPAGPVTFDPADVERIRRALELARSVALWDRGVF